MNPPRLADALREACTCLAQARTLLQEATPESLMLARDMLRDGKGRINSLRSMLPQPGKRTILLDGLDELRQELAAITVLLESAADQYEGSASRGLADRFAIAPTVATQAMTGQATAANRGKQ